MDHRHRGERLFHAVLVNLELVARQIIDENAPAVLHGHVGRDEIDLDAEVWLLLSTGRSSPGRWCLGGRLSREADEQSCGNGRRPEPLRFQSHSIVIMPLFGRRGMAGTSPA